MQLGRLRMELCNRSVCAYRKGSLRSFAVDDDGRSKPIGLDMVFFALIVAAAICGPAEAQTAGPGGGSFSNAPETPGYDPHRRKSGGRLRHNGIRGRGPGRVHAVRAVSERRFRGCGFPNGAKESPERQGPSHDGGRPKGRGRCRFAIPRRNRHHRKGVFQKRGEDPFGDEHAVHPCDRAGKRRSNR